MVAPTLPIKLAWTRCTLISVRVTREYSACSLNGCFNISVRTQLLQGGLELLVVRSCGTVHNLLLSSSCTLAANPSGLGLECCQFCFVNRHDVSKRGGRIRNTGRQVLARMKPHADKQRSITMLEIPHTLGKHTGSGVTTRRRFIYKNRSAAFFFFETMRVLAPFHFQHTLHHTAIAKPTPTQPHTACQSGFCVH